MIKSDLSFM